MICLEMPLTLLHGTGQNLNKKDKIKDTVIENSGGSDFGRIERRNSRKKVTRRQCRGIVLAV